MAHYLNNCVNRDHKALFGDDAFYDLDTSGPQAEKHSEFRKEDSCVVASQPAPDVVKFSWYKFTRFRTATDDRKMSVRVLVGTFEKEESMPKAEAAKHESYRPFFDKNGNFKRQSVL